MSEPSEPGIEEIFEEIFERALSALRYAYKEEGLTIEKIMATAACGDDKDLVEVPLGPKKIFIGRDLTPLERAVPWLFLGIQYVDSNGKPKYDVIRGIPYTKLPVIGEYLEEGYHVNHRAVLTAIAIGVYDGLFEVVYDDTLNKYMHGQMPIVFIKGSPYADMLRNLARIARDMQFQETNG